MGRATGSCLLGVPLCVCGAPLSSALWSWRGARIEGVRPNDATTDTAASGTRQHGPTGPRPVRSAVRSAVRRVAAVGCGSAAHTKCHALRSHRRRARAANPDSPTGRHDGIESDAMFAWYLEINRLIIRRKKRHSSITIWIHGVKPFVCTKITRRRGVTGMANGPPRPSARAQRYRRYRVLP